MITSSEKRFIDTLITHGKKNNITEKQTLLAVGLYAKSVGAFEYLMNYLKMHQSCKTDDMFECINTFCKIHNINTNDE